MTTYAVHLLTADGLQLVAILPATDGPAAIDAVRRLVAQAPGAAAFVARTCAPLEDPLAAGRWRTYRAGEMVHCPVCAKAMRLTPERDAIVAVRPAGDPPDAEGTARHCCRACKAWVELLIRRSETTLSLALRTA